MISRRWIAGSFLLLGLSLIVGPKADGQTVDAQRVSPLLGTWRLVSYSREIVGTGERIDIFGARPRGVLNYAPDGRMMLVIVHENQYVPRDLILSSDEKIKLYDSFIAYAGTYTVADGKIVHHIDAAWNQTWTGTNQTRFYTIEGNRLTLKTAVARGPADGEDGIGMLVWERVK